MTGPLHQRPRQDRVVHASPPLPTSHRCGHRGSRRLPLQVIICAFAGRSGQHACRGFGLGSKAVSRRPPVPCPITLVPGSTTALQHEEAVAAIESSGNVADQLYQRQRRRTKWQTSPEESQRSLLSRLIPSSTTAPRCLPRQRRLRPEDARLESNHVLQWLRRDKRQPPLLNARKSNAATTFFGALFSLTIVLVLASGYGAGDDPVGVGPGAEVASATMKAFVESSVVVDDLERLRDNIIDATVPLTASDALSVAVGEGFAGVLGGFVSAVLSSALSSVLGSTLRSATASDTRQQDVDTMTTARREGPGGISIGDEVVASGDFFLTRAAALPLLEATGLSSSLAAVASVVVATVPYEIVKYNQRQRGMLKEEDMMLQQLLEERRAELQQQWLARIPRWTPRSSVDPSSLKPVLQDSDMKLDLVEIFADVTKWLGYAVLVENYGGTLAWSGITGSFPYAENFIWGAVANLSSQFYTDFLYALFGFGGEDKQRAVTSRSPAEWSSLYLSSAVAGATLFGVYEASQIPAKVLTSALFSGGVEGCVGSTDYNLCVESFLFNGISPPGPSLEAQTRAIFTTAASLWNRLGLDTPF